MQFEKLEQGRTEKIREMSQMATAIVREHFDPLIGKAQNDYMLARFQTVEAITEQLKNGYQYYFVKENGENIGFVAFYPRPDCLYLSKFYLYKEARGKGYSRAMLDFVIENARAQGRSAVELNVNRDNFATHVYERLGFQKIREEKNDIGEGFYMDDFVYRLEL